MLNLLRLTDGSNYYWWTRAGFSDDYVVWFFVFSSFLFGSCLGSFLNVCIWRMPLGESIVTAPSHCPKCGTPIRWFDNIPVVSYLALRGRCRSCKAPISPRYVIVEALTGILFALLLFKVGATQQPPFTLLLYFTMTLLCITTIWIDFEHRLIPDATTYPAILFGLAASAAFPSAWGVSNHLLSGAYALISGAAAGGGARSLRDRRARRFRARGARLGRRQIRHGRRNPARSAGSLFRGAGRVAARIALRRIPRVPQRPETLPRHGSARAVPRLRLLRMDVRGRKAPALVSRFLSEF